MNAKKIVFDVGANNGNSCHYMSNENCVVYAFEPTPFLLREHLYPKANENYIVVPAAVSDFNGITSFNIAGQSDWGCSSLNTFESNLSDTWPGRDDFKITETIEVNVIRMDSFIEQHKIRVIDFLHCDVQGSDLKVLQSFGKHINIIQSGVVEAYEKNPLYRESSNDKKAIIEFLEQNNFEITSICSNDVHNNEININFRKI